MKPETDASRIFASDAGKAKDLRSIGFGTVLTHQQDGIARGTGAVVTLGDSRENFEMIKEKAAAFYSFDRGSSSQSYPNSLMGMIALLRQTYLDAQWYKTNQQQKGQTLACRRGTITRRCHRYLMQPINGMYFVPLKLLTNMGLNIS